MELDGNDPSSAESFTQKVLPFLYREYQDDKE
jgi:hypothetical protein